MINVRLQWPSVFIATLSLLLCLCGALLLPVSTAIAQTDENIKVTPAALADKERQKEAQQTAQQTEKDKAKAKDAAAIDESKTAKKSDTSVAHKNNTEAQTAMHWIEKSHSVLANLSAYDLLLGFVAFFSALFAVFVEDLKKATTSITDYFNTQGVYDFESFRDEFPYIINELWQPREWFDTTAVYVIAQPLETIVLLAVLAVFSWWYFADRSRNAMEPADKIMPTMDWMSDSGGNQDIGAANGNGGNGNSNDTAPSPPASTPPDPTPPTPTPASTSSYSAAPAQPAPTPAPTTPTPTSTPPPAYTVAPSQPAPTPTPTTHAPPPSYNPVSTPEEKQLAAQRLNELKHSDETIDESELALNRARIYIDVPGHRQTAIDLLQQVIANGSADTKEQADKMLLSLKEQGHKPSINPS